MLNYKDVVVAENRHKVYLCELPSLECIRLIVAENQNDKDYAFFDYDNSNSNKVYQETDVVEIYYEVEPDEQEEFDNYDEYGVKVDYELLAPFTTSVPNVYKYESLDELDIIIKALDEPIVDGLGCSWEEDYKNGLLKSYGLVFFWSEYDDFSCGDPYTTYCKIIDGGRIDE